MERIKNCSWAPESRMKCECSELQSNNKELLEPPEIYGHLNLRLHVHVSESR